MNIIEQTRPQTTSIPGVAHATWAGAADGLSQLSYTARAIPANRGQPREEPMSKLSPATHGRQRGRGVFARR